MFLAAAALGGSPAEFDEESPVEVEINRRDVRVGLPGQQTAGI